MPVWHNRPRVWLPSLALPELAALVAGSELSDDSLIRLLFNPVITAAADSMKVQLEELIRIGVKLKDVSLERLEWDLKHELGKQLQAYHSTRNEEADDELIGAAVFDVAAEAERIGYDIDPKIKHAVEGFHSTVLERDLLKTQKDKVNADLAAVVIAVSGKSKKERKRFRKALFRAGLDPDLYLAPLKKPTSS